MTQLISILANLTLVVVIFLYFRQVIRSESTPNLSTWGIWGTLFTLNAITYYEVVSGDLFKWALTLTAMIGLTLIFLYSLVRGRFGPIGVTEGICTVLAIAVGVFWKTTGDAIVSNLLLQVIYLISFVPTVVGLMRGELHERSLPWDLSVLAYALQVLLIAMDWGEGSMRMLVHPVVNGIIGNGSVALTIRLVRNRPTTLKQIVP